MALRELRRLLAIISLGCLVATSFASVQGPSIQYFDSSIYNPSTVAMDAALGISSFAIENFEDSTMIPGLTISLAGWMGDDDARAAGPLTSPPVISPYTTKTWDGGNVTENRIPATGYRTRTIFNLPPAIKSFGIGLSDFNQPMEHRILVNGEFLAYLNQLPGWTWAGITNQRNGYLIIRATEGFLETVEIRQTAQPSFVEGVEFDHLAVYVPDPTASVSAIFVAGWLLVHRRRVILIWREP